MKNIVKINLDNNCDCDCLYSLGGNENSVNLELQHDSYVNPILALTSDIGTISITDFELVGDSLIKYQISQKYWNVDEQISLTVSDGDWISDPITFQCKAMKDCDNIRVKKLDDGYMIYPFVAGVDATGKTIKSIVEQYYLSTSPTAMLGGNWDTKYPGWENNKYIWTRSIYTYSDETTLTTTAICVTGSKGDKGETGAKGEKGDKGDPGEQGLRGLQGPQGEQGIQGPAGADGKSSYTHIAYANSADGNTDFSVSDSDRTYIGMYVDENPIDSTDPDKYAWTKIKGADGTQGTPGKPGADGKTPYLHIAYANSSDGNKDFDITDSIGKSYIGQYTDFAQADSMDPSSYSWTKIKGETGAKGEKGDKGDPGEQGPRGLQGLQGEKGEQGIPGPTGATGAIGPQGLQGVTGPQGPQGPAGKDGANGKTSYFHIKYSPVVNPTSASQMTETPDTYIGTYVDYTKADSTDPKKYTWYRFQGLQGAQGTQGIPGTNGTNGKTSYLHIKYSNDGGKTFTSNSGETVGDYIGQCTDFNQADPTTVGAYTWSKIKGDTGDAGRGIKSAVTTFQVGASGTTIPTGTWSSSVPATSAAKPYLWSKTVTTYTDNTTSVAYSVGSTPEGVLDKINKVLRYDDTTVVLGKTGSNATLNLKNDAVTIQKGSTPAASFTPDKLALGNGYFEIECIPDDTGAKKIVNLKSIDSLVQAMELHIFNTENTDSAAMYLSQVELPSGVGAASKGTGIVISAEHIFFKPKRSLTYDIPVLTDDCNNLTASGKYYLSNKSTNRPVNKNGWLECMKYSTNYCFQKYITYDGEEYTRLMQAGTWGGWSYASGWKSLGTWNSVGNKTVNNLSLYNEICYIMGYANTLQCQETGILPMSYFQTGRNILVRDAANGQNFEFKYVNATTINIGSVTNGNWGLALYVK